jgi:hypothetical protein
MKRMFVVLIGVMGLIGVMNCPASVEAGTGGTGSVSGTIAGHANSAGLPGVSVTLYEGTDPNIADEDARSWVAETQTDAGGAYQFTGLTQRRYRVHIHDQEISGTHYMEADQYHVQVLDGADTPNMDIVIRQAGLIWGYVKTANGDPIQNAEVITDCPWTHEGDEWHTTLSGSDGKYELWVAPSPGKFYPVLVRGTDLYGISYEAKSDGNLYRATCEGTHGPDFLLEPAGAITGKVVNEDDAGIADVFAKLGWNGQTEYGEVDDWAFTGQDGSFTLNHVPAGTNYVYLCNDWREIEQGDVKYMAGQAYKGPVTIVAGETVDAGVFTIYEAGMITGVVTSVDGSPVVGVEVEIEGTDVDGNCADREDVATDAFGQYTIDYVAPGIYSMWFSKDGFIAGRVIGVNVEKGEVQDVDVVIKSDSEGASLSGKITNYADVASYDPDGVLLPSYDDSDYEDLGFPGFGLLAISMDREYTEDDYLDIGRFFVGFADQEDIEDGYGDYFEEDLSETPGNYEMALANGDIAVGMYVYRNYKPGWGGSAILHDWKRYNFSKGDVRAGVDFRATTAQTGTQKGNITVPDSYNYFTEGWCTIYAVNEANQTAVPLGDAVAFPGWTTSYEFRYLPAGSYTLKAYARNLASVLYSSVTVTAGQTSTQNITFTAGGTLNGQVTDGATAVSGATVLIVETGLQATTDTLGNYTIVGINTGSYTVKASASGYADAEAAVSVTSGSTTTQDLTLDTTVGSISGTLKDAEGGSINGATVVAYNETDDTFQTAETVDGEFTVTQLTPGEYILAVDTPEHGVVVYPSDDARITLSARQEIAGQDITAGSKRPPLFTVHSSASNTTPVALAMEFYSDKYLNADPVVTVAEGSGSLGPFTVNSARNRFEINYTADPADTIVKIKIEEDSNDPLVIGDPASRTFTFEVGSNLVQTGSTNVTNAIGGTASIMGTQDNTEVYVPPFAIAGADGDTQALSLTIERYGDPGDSVEGTTDTSVSAVYDFSFDEEGVSIDVNHTFTVTMSFELPDGMTQDEFESTLEMRYFDAGDQQWKTDGISNVRINWANSTIIFEVSHLTKFAAFTPSDTNGDDDNDNDDDGDGGCFIATAAFGSYMETHVEILRNFRDVYLLTNRAGRAFVSLYYKYSPPVADFIAKHGTLKAAVRCGLYPLVGLSYVVLHTTLAQKAFMMVGMAFALSGAIMLNRRPKNRDSEIDNP